MSCAGPWPLALALRARIHDRTSMRLARLQEEKPWKVFYGGPMSYESGLVRRVSCLKCQGRRWVRPL